MEGLEDKADQLIAKTRSLDRGEDGDRPTINDHIAAIGSIQKTDKIQEGALT
ncbi:hypothetical protein GCM10009434_10290 [Brevundimonas olei]